MNGTILDARAVIVGEDRTGPMWASFARNASAATKAAAGFNRSSAAISLSSAVASQRMVTGMSESIAASQRMIAGLSAVGRAAEVANAKLSMFSRTMGGMHGAVASAWKNVGPFVEGSLGFGVLHETKKAIEAGASLQDELVRMKVAGIPQAEISAERKQAFDLAAKYPNMSPAEVLQSYKETRSVLLKPSETAALMDTVVAAKSVMKELGMGEQIGDALQFAVKSAEVLGRAQDPKRFKAYIDSFIRALEVSGKTLTPEDMFRFSQQMKAAGATLSDRFINTVGMSMIQDMGSRAATGLAQLSKMMVGGYTQGQKRSLTEMFHLGMVERRDIEWGREGIKGLRPGRHVKDWQLWLSDPDKAVNKDLIPTLKKHGYVTLQSQIAEVFRLYPNQQAGNVVAKLIQQSLSFEQHARNYERAYGVDAASVLLRENARAGWDALTISLQTFESALTDPLMEPVAGKLFDISTGIASLGREVDKFDTRHPTLGKYLGGGAVLGGLTLGGLGIYKMFSGFAGGFGLKSSAAALDASAASLDAAAAKLGAPATATKAAATSAGAGVGGAVVAASSAAVTAAVTGGIVALDVLKHDSSHGNEFRSWLRSKLGIPDPHEPAPWMPGGAWHESAPQSLPTIDVLARGDASHLGGGIAEQLSAIADRRVKLEGSGDVDVTISVKLDQGLIQDEIKKQLSSSGNISLKANTGLSMPEARPYRKGRQ